MRSAIGRGEVVEHVTRIIALSIDGFPGLIAPLPTRVILEMMRQSVLDKPMHRTVAHG